MQEAKESHFRRRAVGSFRGIPVLGATGRALVLASALSCVQRACGEGTGTLSTTLWTCQRSIPVQRLRGGWGHPMLPDVFSHPIPDLQPQDVPKFMIARDRSRSWFPRLRRKTQNQDSVQSALQDYTAASNVNSVCQTIMVEAPLEECFAAATGFEEYPKWAGAIQGFDILERAPCGLGQLVEWEMGMFGITTKNKMKYEYELPSASSGRAVMKWHVTEGGIKELVGRYEFISMGPSSTKMVYSLFVEPGFPLPEMVKRATNRAVAKAALQDLKKYTERVRAEKKQSEAGNAQESVLPFSGERELFDLGYL